MEPVAGNLFIEAISSPRYVQGSHCCLIRTAIILFFWKLEESVTQVPHGRFNKLCQFY
jgi:hypothetical protein